MRNILDILVAKNRELGIFYIQDNEWQNIENIIQLLEPIFLATEILSSSTYPTISDVQLIFIGLLRHLESFIQNQNNLEDCVMANSINYDKCDEAISSLQNLMPLYKINNQLGNTRINTQSQENKRSYFEFLLTDQTSEERPTDDEITRYISAPIINTNPLEWWQRFEKDFPILSQIALCYLSIQGSSVPSEQAFSMASNTITKIRCNLKPETTRAVMCLKSWIQQVRDKKESDKFEESFFLEC
ncbi:8886_t:CDS:2 [Entrophospora sp. SA101]|nr:8886_t:CDS:2 [Entrophospora sp. SA101]